MVGTLRANPPRPAGSLTVALPVGDDGPAPPQITHNKDSTTAMRSHWMLRLLRAALPAAAVVVAAANDADAQTATGQSIALDRFTPAPAGDRMFGVESPFVAGDLTP